MSLMFHLYTRLPHVCPYLPIDHLSILSLQGRRLQEAPWLTGLCLVSTGWYPPTSPVARVTDGFSLPKHSVSISVTSQIGERERGRVGETQSILHFPWHMAALKKKKVYSECSFMFISEAVSHSLSHFAQHQSCTLFSGWSVSWHELKKQVSACDGLSMIHYHNIPPFCTHWMLKHSVLAACSMKGKILWFKTN